MTVELPRVKPNVIWYQMTKVTERTKNGIAAARAKGRRPLDMRKLEAAIKRIEAKTSPAEAARQLGLGRSTIYTNNLLYV